MRGIFALIMVVLSSVADAGLLDRSVVVSTEQGPVEGVIKRGGTRVFLGIPYAEPPVGRLRWRGPQKPARRDGLLQATKPGNICLQLALVTGRVVGSEDCLYLNIWAPEAARSKKLPVMFWIHGGAFILGDGIQAMGPISLYDGTRLAETGEVVVVTINYRLGPMGFMANSQLARENRNGSTGNYGLLDQIEALKWVKRNIENFGGDPDRITIFGESAGGASVLALLASPLAHGLYSGAISQSGPLLEQSLEMAMIQGERAISKYGDSRGRMSIDKLREVPGETIVRDFPLTWSTDGSKPQTQYGPVIDGHVLRRPILETLERGEGAQVPLIIGSNRDEMTMLAPIFMKDIPKRLNDEEYFNLVSHFHGEAAKQIVQVYNRERHGSNWQALMDLMTDAQFHSPAQLVAAAMERYKPHSTYVYLFSQEVNFLRAGHATELPYIFQNPALLHMFSHRPFRPVKSLFHYSDQVELSDQMIRYWTRFAHTGTPNEPRSGDLYWPDSSDDQMMHFESRNTKVIDSYRRDHVEFLSEVACMNLLEAPGIQQAVKEKVAKTGQ